MKCPGMDVQRITLLNILITFLLQEVFCEVYPSRQIVNDILSSRYKKEVRPRCPDEPSVTVILDVALRQIIELEEPEQTLQTNAWLRVNWYDCRLKWNETETGIANIVIPAESVWTPDLTLYDNAESESKRCEEENSRVTVTSEGNVRLQVPVVMTTLCSIDTTYFPFDKQSCPITFGSWAYNGLEVNITTLNNHGDTASYIEHEEWQLSGMDAERDEGVLEDIPYPIVQYVLTLRRKPLYYVTNLVFPCLLVTSLSILGFILPSDNGDKNNVEITVLLALTVFQLIVKDLIPPNSESVPLISVYFAASLSLVGLSCLMNVVILNLFFKSDYGWPVPKVVKSVVIDGLGKVTCVQQQDNDEEMQSAEDKRGSLKDKTPKGNGANGANGANETSVLLWYLDRINDSLRGIVSNFISTESEDSEDWKVVALILDRLFLVLHVFSNFLMLVIFAVEFFSQ